MLVDVSPAFINKWEEDILLWDSYETFLFYSILQNSVEIVSSYMKY